MRQYIDKFCGNIIKEGFSETNIKFSQHSFDERYFIKADSPVFYTVSITSDEFIDFDLYINEKCDFSEKIYGFLNTTFAPFFCKSAVCLNIIFTENIDDKKIEFLKSLEFYPEAGHYNIWWIYDLSEKRLYTGNNHPDKIINIEKCLPFQNNNKINREIKKSVGNKNIIFTKSLMFINIIIFAVMMITGNRDEFINMFGNSSYYIRLYNQFYRLFTCMFIHSDLIHIAQNMISLYIFGGMTERFYGTFETGVIYFFSGICGSILSFLVGGGISVGASGAIFGLIACILYTSKRNKKSIEGINYSTMLILVAINIMLGFVETGVDNMGHIGGFIGGIISSIVMYGIL